MKTLKLVFSRIRFYITSNVLIFVMFAIGCIICSLSFLFFYGNISTKRLEAADNNALKYYELELDKPLSLDEIKNNKFLNNLDLSDIVVNSYLSVDDIPLLKEKDYSFEKGYFNLSASLNNIFLDPEKGRTEFNNTEVEGGTNVVVLPGEDDFYSMEPGEKIELKGQEYENIGISISFNKFFIPYKTFEKSGYKVDSFILYLNHSVSEAEDNEIAQRLSQNFPNIQIVDSPGYEYDTAKNRASGEIALFSVVFMISILSFMFLMKFMSEKSNYELVTYSIVGASKRKTVLILLLTNVIISAAFAVIASLLHCVLYDCLFSRLNIEDNTAYYFSDYFICGIITVILSCLTSIPFILSSVKSSIIKNKNKYNE